MILQYLLKYFICLGRYHHFDSSNPRYVWCNFTLLNKLINMKLVYIRQESSSPCFKGAY